MWISWDKKLMLPLPDMLCVACVWLGRDRNPAPRAGSCCPVQSPQSLNPCAPGQNRLFPTCLSGPMSSRSARYEPPLLVDHTFLQGRAYFDSEMPGANNVFIPSCSLLAYMRACATHVATHTHQDTLMDAAATPWPKEMKGKAGRAPLGVVHGAKLTGGLCFAENVPWKSQGCGHYLHKF